jgi:hypothetical protein
MNIALLEFAFSPTWPIEIKPAPPFRSFMAGTKLSVRTFDAGTDTEQRGFSAGTKTSTRTFTTE